MSSFSKKVILGIVIAIIGIILLYHFGLSHYLSLASVKTNAAYLLQQTHEHYVASAAIFMLISTGLIAFTLPVTAPVAVVAGYLFGLLPALVYCMAAVLIGSGASFLVIRYVTGHIAKNDDSDRLDKFKVKLQRYGYSYLITLQLLTVIPYFIINTLAALGGVPFHIFMMTTFVGSLPVVAIYAFAGRQLYHITSWSDIISWDMLLVLLLFAFLAMLPMIVRKFRKI